MKSLPALLALPTFPAFPADPNFPVRFQYGDANTPKVGIRMKGNSSFLGLDQVNIGPLPRTLAGRGTVNLHLTVDGNRSNTVSLNIQ